MSRIVAVALTLLCLPLLLGADAGKQPDAPPGGISLLEGYQQQHDRGIDSEVGHIWKDGGITIKYDIGNLAGDYTHNVGPNDRAWSRRQTAHGRVMEVVKTKQGELYVCFPADRAHPANGYPANFWAK